MSTPERKKEYAAMLQTRIERAVTNVKQAEEELEAAMRDLSPLGVGEDGMITHALEDCFEKLRAAKQLVVDLREVLARLP